MSQLLTNCQTLIRQGVEQHEACKNSLKTTKAFAFDAGLLFLSAKAACADGEWLENVEMYGGGTHLRTVQRYMRFASECLEWAQEQNPNLIDKNKLTAAARTMVLQSALSFMDLCRDLGAIAQRPANGARDGKAGRSIQQAQFSFNWDVFDASLMTVERSEGNPFLAVPREELQLSRQRAAFALEMMDEALKTEAVNALIEVSTATTVDQIV